MVYSPNIPPCEQARAKPNYLPSESRANMDIRKQKKKNKGRQGTFSIGQNGIPRGVKHIPRVEKSVSPARPKAKRPVISAHEVVKMHCPCFDQLLSNDSNTPSTFYKNRSSFPKEVLHRPRQIFLLHVFWKPVKFVNSHTFCHDLKVVDFLRHLDRSYGCLVGKNGYGEYLNFYNR